jgi:hypothetical protein
MSALSAVHPSTHTDIIQSKNSVSGSLYNKTTPEKYKSSIWYVFGKRCHLKEPYFILW